ncbi:MAG: Gfo/Idh/MocA family oxidoreductase, partial [Rhodothermales bacterium]
GTTMTNREIIEKYYAKTRGNGNGGGVRAYADFRELFDREDDIDAAVIITPDHAHTTLALAALKKGVAAISHKPVSNVLHEVHLAVDAARNSKAATHLLAYADITDLNKLDAWIKAGEIGTLREVHNWTGRPFWPQGALDYPVEQPPVPAGFDWDLWLGPEPHRPYHPALTFAVYRGWYNYGGGCFADMGNYSLWGIYTMLDLDVPVSVEARANSVAFVKEDNVAGHSLSQVSYPMAGTLHFHHAARGARPAIDVFWYEGGIKPQTPSELRDAGEQFEDEGMMFVGDHGKILCDYRGTNPRILGREIPPEEEEVEGADSNDEWVNAIKNGGKSRGSFESVSPLAEATALQGIAFRFSGQRLDWDAASKSFTNVPEANQLIHRVYRPGWEL